MGWGERWAHDDGVEALAAERFGGLLQIRAYGVHFLWREALPIRAEIVSPDLNTKAISRVSSGLGWVEGPLHR